MTAIDVVQKLGAQIKIRGLQRDSEALHAVGNAMSAITESDAQALIDELEEWAGVQ